jgi:hypothetical protein
MNEINVISEFDPGRNFAVQCTKPHAGSRGCRPQGFDPP